MDVQYIYWSRCTGIFYGIQYAWLFLWCFFWSQDFWISMWTIFVLIFLSWLLEKLISMILVLQFIFSRGLLFSFASQQDKIALILWVFLHISRELTLFVMSSYLVCYLVDLAFNQLHLYGQILTIFFNTDNFCPVCPINCCCAYMDCYCVEVCWVMNWANMSSSVGFFGYWITPLLTKKRGGVLCIVGIGIWKIGWFLLLCGMPSSFAAN